MFKVSQDFNSCTKSLSFNGKILFKWYRKKLLLRKLEGISRVVSGLAGNASPAEGAFRDIQKIQVVFLDVLNKFLKENELVYWVDFGTLIGAARNGRFIPWDDDIDVTMPRKHYDRLLSLQNHLPAGFYFEEFNERGFSLIKLKNKKISSKIGLDIFSADFIKEGMDISDALAMSSKLFKFQREKINHSTNERLRLIQQYFECEGFHFVREAEEASMLCYGGEFIHSSHPSVIIPLDRIFPLSEIEFEGKKYPAPKDVYYCLTLLYGDYRMPDSSKMPHINMSEISIEDMIKNNEFLEGV